MNAISRHVVVTQDVPITAEATRVPATVAIQAMDILVVSMMEISYHVILTLLLIIKLKVAA